MWQPKDIQKLIDEHAVLLIGKGTKELPQCGFTARAITILNQCDIDYCCVDVFEDLSIRSALIELTKWPTTPQVFVGGELLGGSDDLLVMFKDGSLQDKISKLKSAK